MAVGSGTYRGDPSIGELKAGELRIGGFRADRATGDLTGAAGTTRLEPKVMELLFLLASQPGQVLSRERITEALWPEVVVGDDSLARTVSKLRQALGDDAKAPRYVETLSKRGYRLLAPVDSAPPLSPAGRTPRLHAWTGRARQWWVAVALAAVMVGLAWWLASRDTTAPTNGSSDSAALLARADDFYFQFARADNEAAIDLYQRVLGVHPDDPAALSGLANALAQRSIRWPQLPGGTAIEFTRLRDALAHGHLQQDPARPQLRRARQLAERAVELAPRSAAAHKASGLVAGAQGRLEAALASQQRAVMLDPEAWGPMINIADLLEISGRDDEALPYYERAYAAMDRAYARSPARVRPWQPQLGTLIAERHLARGDRSAAEAWYRRVLRKSPLHPDATRGLAGLLRTGGDPDGAHRLCTELGQRTGVRAPCSTVPPASR